MSFIDTHGLSDAFLGYRIGRLFDVVWEQGDEYHRTSGLSFPARANSTIMIISERENVCAADITEELALPHQLIAQRIELLIELGLVVKKPDPDDGRRNILKLTKKGEQEVVLLRRCLADAIRAFNILFDEIGVDLNKVARLATDAFMNKPLSERISQACAEEVKTTSVRKTKLGNT
ncbi:MAG: helix-turn-helix domain-containing protein [Pseudomonadota bacterium]